MEAVNVRAVRYTATGACGVGRARIMGLVIKSGAGDGRITITEGSGGPVRLDLDVHQNSTVTVDIPGDGIVCASDPQITTLTNIAQVTIFFV